MTSLLTEANLPVLVSIVWVLNFHLLAGIRDYSWDSIAGYQENSVHDRSSQFLSGFAWLPTCADEERRVLTSCDKERFCCTFSSRWKADNIHDIGEYATNSASRGGGRVDADWLMVGGGLFLLGLTAAGCACFQFNSKYEVDLKDEIGGQNSANHGEGNGIPGRDSQRISVTVDDIEPSDESDFTVPVLVRARWTKSVIIEEGESVTNQLRVTHDDDDDDDDDEDRKGDLTRLDLAEIQTEYIRRSLGEAAMMAWMEEGERDEKEDVEPETAHPSSDADLVSGAPGKDVTTATVENHVEASTVLPSEAPDADDKRMSSRSQSSEDESQNENVVEEGALSGTSF